MFVPRRAGRAAVVLVAAVLACSPVVAAARPVTPDASTAGVAQVRHDGPHSPVGRIPARTTVTRSGGVVTRDVDLGDVELGRRPGQFRSPVRGVLFTPDRARANAPLIVVSHLRYPACLQGMGAYPCPGPELRYDRGMSYLGRALARQGYAVLIPDLAPLWIGEGLDTPYDQRAGWFRVVDRLRDEVVAADAGGTTRLGTGLRDAIDTSRVGLVVHSRPGYLTTDIVRGWAHSSTPVDAVLAYGAAKYVPEIIGEWSPPPADVPWLSIVGDADVDVRLDTRLWLTEHVSVPRRTAALDVVVPGYGHHYANRALSSRGDDDRENCGRGCPTAMDHEKLLVDAAADFFGATLRGRRTTLPLTSTASVPATIAGVGARWLAVTGGPRRILYTAGRHQRTLTTFGRGASARECRYNAEPVGDGPHPPVCPPVRGDMRSLGAVSRVVLTPSAGVRARSARPARGVRVVVLQVAPSGTRAVGGPLRLTLLAGSRRHPVAVPGSTVLADRGPAGIYVTSTLRVRVPARLRGVAVTGVELSSARGTTRLDLRSIDLVTGSSR